MKVLLAVDESPYSAEVVNGVKERFKTPDTTVRVLHVVEKFVPPAHALWYDAGGDLKRAKVEVVERSSEMTERAAEHLRGRGLTPRR